MSIAKNENQRILELCNLSSEFNSLYNEYLHCWQLSEVNPTAVLGFAETCLPVFKQFGFITLQSLCKTLQGKCHYFIGNFSEASTLFTEALHLSNTIDYSTGKVYCLFYFAMLKTKLNFLSEAIDMWDEAEILCRKIGRNDILIKVITNKATTLLETGEYVKAFEHITNALDSLQELDEQNRSSAFALLGSIYFALNDKENGLKYTLESLELDTNNTITQLSKLINTSISYLELGELKKCELYLERCEELAFEMNDQYHIAYTFFIRSSICIANGQYEIADELMNKSIGIFEKIDAPKQYLNCLVIKADILYKTSKIREAIELLESIYEQVRYKSNEPLLLLQHLSLLSECYYSINNMEAALEKQKQHRIIKDEWINEERQKQITLFNIQMKGKEIDYEKEKLRFNNTILKNDNERKKNQIALLAKNITHVNKVITEASGGLNKILTGDNSIDAGYKIETLQSSINSYLLHPDEWGSFEEQFNNLFPDYQKRVLEICDSLTPTELRVCLLLKANLSTKEISSILCISARAVEGHRLSIRKKFQLIEKESLIIFLQKL